MHLFIYLVMYLFISCPDRILRALAREQLLMWVTNVGYNRAEGQRGLKGGVV